MPRIKVAGAGLTDREARAPYVLLRTGAKSPLAWRRSTAVLLTAFFQSRPIPVRRNFSAWDCKVTPARCACQEGNTIGCIPSNDGLDAGLAPGFPHRGRPGSDRVGLRVTEAVIATTIVGWGGHGKRLGKGSKRVCTRAGQVTTENRARPVDRLCQSRDSCAKLWEVTAH